MCIFLDSGMFNEIEGGLDFPVKIKLSFPEKTFQTHIIVPNKQFVYVLINVWEGIF